MSNKQERTLIFSVFEFIYFSEIFSLKHRFSFQNLIDIWFLINFIGNIVYLNFCSDQTFFMIFGAKVNKNSGQLKINKNFGNSVKPSESWWREIIWYSPRFKEKRSYAWGAPLRRGWDSSAITGSRSAPKPSSFDPARKTTLHKSDLRVSKIWERNDRVNVQKKTQLNRRVKKEMLPK